MRRRGRDRHRLVAEGRLRYWGLTGTGWADALIELLTNGPHPDYIQCISNRLDSPGGLLPAESPNLPRDIIAAANANNSIVRGIRAVQAGALTDAIGRTLPPGHSELADYARAAPFRAIADEVGKPAALLEAMSLEGSDCRSERSCTASLTRAASSPVAGRAGVAGPQDEAPSSTSATTKGGSNRIIAQPLPTHSVDHTETAEPHRRRFW